MQRELIVQWGAEKAKICRINYKEGREETLLMKELKTSCDSCGLMTPTYISMFVDVQPLPHYITALRRHIARAVRGNKQGVRGSAGEEGNHSRERQSLGVRL